MRVLYVEDDDNLAFAVEKMLTQAGHLCDRVRSGAGAVKLGQSNNYDLILLDVMLPDIDGYEVIRLLQGAGINTPVLIQSGLVERDKAMDGLGFGVDDYLIKPFNRDELLRQVRRAAGRSGNVLSLPGYETPNGAASMTAEEAPKAPASMVIALRDESAAKTVAESAPETASETMAETTAETAAEKADETTAETTAETTVDTTVETPTEMTAETPAETTAETSTEIVAETPAELIAETLAETEADTIVETVAEIVAEAAAETAKRPPLPDSFPGLPAKIVVEESQIDIDCTVISVTSGGAVLHLYDELIECPELFRLAVAGDKTYRSQTCWRHGDKVGVKFL